MSNQRLNLPRTQPTPQAAYWSRRRILAAAGLAVAAPAAAWVWLKRGRSYSPEDIAVMSRPGIERTDVLAHFPAARNDAYNLDSPLTDPVAAFSHHNYYEFTTDKSRVWQLAKDFTVDPWTIEVSGLCHKPRTFGIDDFFKRFGADQEERTYRFRCVEAWAMDVPWTGVELNKLLRAVEPRSDAKFVRFVSAFDKEQMPGGANTPWMPWPYHEGLRMDEAMHPLTLLATGLYGKPLTRGNGAPFRLIVPWKYGYKSAKAIVRIELVAQRPKTFWSTLQPREYPFESNVDPAAPHPRWSQASEQVIPDMRRRRTLPYNGYGEHVAHLYA